mmetsp:Transcript_12121/g.48783  ORF Transcript_12121/g.48783 Transcript_12121/m.48783 type:complete len:299 (-) Transcript_12121:1042-1938(-)
MIAERSARRRGLGGEAVRLMLSYLRSRTDRRPPRFVAKIGASNAASLALFEHNLGFRKVAYVEAFDEVEFEATHSCDALAKLWKEPHALCEYEDPEVKRDSVVGLRVVRFAVDCRPSLEHPVACVMLLYGRKAAVAWCGRSFEDPRLASLVLAAPRVFSDGDSAGASGLVAWSHLGAALAARLARRSGRLVAVSWALDDEIASVDGESSSSWITHVEVELAKRLPPRGLVPLDHDDHALECSSPVTTLTFASFDDVRKLAPVAAKKPPPPPLVESLDDVRPLPSTDFSAARWPDARVG